MCKGNFNENVKGNFKKGQLNDCFKVLLFLREICFGNLAGGTDSLAGGTVGPVTGEPLGATHGALSLVH